MMRVRPLRRLLHRRAETAHGSNKPTQQSNPVVANDDTVQVMAAASAEAEKYEECLSCQ